MIKIILTINDDWTVLHEACEHHEVNVMDRANNKLKSAKMPVFIVKEPHDLLWLIRTLKDVYDVPLGLNIFEDPINFNYLRGEF